LAISRIRSQDGSGRDKALISIKILICPKSSLWQHHHAWRALTAACRRRFRAVFIAAALALHVTIASPLADPACHFVVIERS
jgi:hypothetical protein